MQDTSSSSEGLPAAPHRRSPLLFTWSSRELLTLEAAYEPEDQERDTDSWESDVSMSGYAADVESGAESECPSEKELLQEEIWDIAVFGGSRSRCASGGLPGPVVDFGFGFGVGWA